MKNKDEKNYGIMLYMDRYFNLCPLLSIKVPRSNQGGLKKNCPPYTKIYV